MLSAKDLADFSTEDEVVKDKNFKRFQKVVQCAPDQVIRFQRSGTPLWITINNIPGYYILRFDKIFNIFINYLGFKCKQNGHSK